VQNNFPATQSKGSIPAPVPMDNSFPHEEEPQVIQTPIDVHKPWNFNQQLCKITKEVPQPLDKPAIKAKAQQSEISTQVGDTEVVNNILNAPITLRVHEVLASSHELSDQLTKMIKQKNAKPSATAHTITGSKDRAMLI
jgi:hypothetical protein